MQVSEHLEAERRTVKALRAELQSLSTSTESHVTKLATELEAKQGLLRGLQSTVQSVKADAESSRSQAEAASSALASLRDAGSDLDRVSVQLNRERQVQSTHIALCMCGAAKCSWQTVGIPVDRADAAVGRLLQARYVLCSQLQCGACG